MEIIFIFIFKVLNNKHEIYFNDVHFVGSDIAFTLLEYDIEYLYLSSHMVFNKIFIINKFVAADSYCDINIFIIKQMNFLVYGNADTLSTSILFY